MKPNNLRGKEVAADGQTPIPALVLGVSAGTKPRHLSIAVYEDKANNLTLRSNYFGALEVASPIDGKPLQLVGESMELTADELHATATQIGSCDNCSTDLYASKDIAPAFANQQGRCTMCGHEVAFSAEDTSEDDTGDADMDEASDAELNSVEDESTDEMAGDAGANRFAFEDMVLVNEDEEGETANVATENPHRAALVAALRKSIDRSKAQASDEGKDEELPTMDEDEDESEDEASEEDMANEDEASEDSEEVAEEEASDDYSEEDMSEDESSEEDMAEEDMSEDESTEEANASVTDVPIDDYKAVDISASDLTGATMVAVDDGNTVVAMLGATPAVRFDKHTASDATKALYGKPQVLRDAVNAALESSTDRVATLATFGGTVCTVQTSMRGYAKQVLDRFTAKADAELASERANYHSVFRHCAETAALGIVKNLFADHRDPLVAEFAATLERHGVRNPSALVYAALRDSLPVFAERLVDKAVALASETESVQSTTAEMVGSAPFPVELPAPVNTAPAATVDQTANTKVTGKPETKPAIAETASDKSALRAHMAAAVSKLGRR